MATIAETPETTREVRKRLIEHQADCGHTWKRISDESGIKNGTLSLWKAGAYTGNNENITANVRRYLDGQEAVGQLRARVGDDPGWLSTPTSRRILTLLRMAHLNDVVAFAGVSGCGKSLTAREYKTLASNVFIVTMDPTTSSVSQMLRAVLRALGDSEPRYGAAPSDLSRRIVSRLAGTKALIIADEAQELCPQALQVMRSWVDLCEIGLAFLGDPRLVQLLRASRKVDLATFNSRIGMQDFRPAVDAADVEVVAAGWGIEDPSAVRFLRQIAAKDGTLRGVVKTIRAANMLASDEERPLELADMKAAWAQRNIDFLTVGG
jgi:DNA transposition AAA+ family ATPase